MDFGYKGSSLINEPQGQKITDGKAVSELVREKNENGIFLITLDGASKILRCEKVEEEYYDLNIASIFKKSFLDNSAAVLISNKREDLQPSRKDFDINNRVREMSKLMGIEFLDYVIVNEESFYSCSDEGVL